MVITVHMQVIEMNGDFLFEKIVALFFVNSNFVGKVPLVRGTSECGVSDHFTQPSRKRMGLLCYERAERLTTQSAAYVD